MDTRNDSNERDVAIARSIVYFRVCAIAALLCAVGSAIIGGLLLAQASSGRVFTGLGFVLITLGIVMFALAGGCVQIVLVLRARANAKGPAPRHPSE